MSELEDICKQTGAEILKPGESVNLEKIQSKDGVRPKNRHQAYDQGCRMEEQADEARGGLSLLSLDRRIEHSQLFKARGNDAFAAGDYPKALKEYLGACWLLRRKTGQFPKSITPASPNLPGGVDAIAIVDYDLEDAANHDDWALVARVTDLRRLAHLNIAAVAIKLKDWDLCEHTCGRVLASEGSTAAQRNKARFRLAKARDGKTDIHGAFKQLNAICADPDATQAQYREARKVANELRARESKQRKEWGGFFKEYASLCEEEPDYIRAPPEPKPHPYPVTHVRKAGDTRPLYTPPKRTEEEKRKMVRQRKAGETDLEAELKELKKGVDVTKPKPPKPEKVPYKGKELYPESEMREARAEARSDRAGRDQRAHHINLNELNEKEAKEMYDGLHAESLEAEKDSNDVDAQMNKISPLARAVLQSLHVSGASKMRIREVYDKCREEEIKRVQHCMAPDEREFINDLVRRQHEFDDEAMDLAFEEIRGDVLCREAAAEAGDEKRALLMRGRDEDHRRPRAGPPLEAAAPPPPRRGATEGPRAQAAAAPRRHHLRGRGPAHGQGQGPPRGLRPRRIQGHRREHRGRRPALRLRPLPLLHPRQAAPCQHGQEERQAPARQVGPGADDRAF